MNIVIIGPANPYRGGIAKFNEMLAENLVAENHTVTIANFTLQYPSFLFPGKSQYTEAVPPAGVDIVRLVSSVNPFNWFRVARRIKQMKPDMVIVRYWMPFFAPALGTICRGVGCPVVALADNIVPHEKHFYDRVCTKYFLGATDAVVYMSLQVGDDLGSFRYKGLRAFSPHPIYDSYGAVVPRDQACEKLGLDASCRYGLFFGFIRDYKGLDLLLEAWAKLEDKNLKLIVAGEYYGNKEKYEAMIRELSLEQQVVVFDHYIAEDQVRYYFSAADIVVQPYRSATQSGVTQVAYHFGVPMLVTRVGGLAEIVPDGVVGYVVEQSADEICAAIKDFYVGERAAEFRENIEVEKRRFEWSRMTEVFMNLYQRILQRVK